MRHLCHWALLCALLALAGCTTPSPGQAPPSQTGSPASPEVSPTAATESPSPTPEPSPESATPEPTRKPMPRKPRLKASVLSSTETALNDTSNFKKSVGKIYLRSAAEAIEPGSKLTARFTDEKNVVEDSVTVDRDTRTVVFGFDPPQGGWTDGVWQLTVKLGDEKLVSRQVRFGEVASKKHAKPRFARLTDDLNSSETQVTYSSARNKDIFLIVDTEKLKPGTPVRTVWIANEAEKLDANELVAESTTKSPPPGRAALFVYRAPPSGFHPGTYQVDVYFEDEKVNSQQFWIKRR